MARGLLGRSILRLRSVHRFFLLCIFETVLLDESFNFLDVVYHVDAFASVKARRFQYPNIFAYKVTAGHNEGLFSLELDYFVLTV
jgi:hypothetical protein